MIVKLQRKGQMVIPRSLSDEPGVSEGTHGTKNRKQAFRELAQVAAELRQEAKEKGLDNMPMKEINRAVAAARRDIRKTGKTATK